jgi:MerR family copper efflux transcriptional regulator
MASADLLTIGRLAQQGGVTIQTVRYYERRGLIPKPNRSPSGYRLYDRGTIRRLGFVRKAQLLGFSLHEIGELLSLRVRPGTTCADIRKKAHQKIATVDEKICKLSQIRGALAKLASDCRGKGPTSECPILETLDADEARTA